MYSLRTFGSLALTRDGLAVEPFGASRKSLAILTVLATDGTVTRDRLMALLWPESDTERARGSLKQATHALRQQLQAPDLVIGRSDLSLNPDLLESDVARFRTALEKGNLLEAITLYRGAFLDGVHLNGSAELEEWVEARRGALALEYRNALEGLAREAQTRGDAGEAVRWWNRRADEDPLDGRAALHLMQALEADGRRTAALQHLRTHEEVLRRELGLTPDPALLALGNRLRQTRPESSPEGQTEPGSNAGSGEAELIPAVPHASRDRLGPTTSARRSSRVRAAVVALVAIAAVGIVIAASRRSAEDPAAEPNLLAVAPFNALDPSLELWREGLMDILSEDLDGAGPLRTVAQSVALRRWSGRANRGSAERFGGATGAGLVVYGQIARLGKDSVSIRASLLDRSENAGSLELFELAGNENRLGQLVDTLGVKILRTLGRTRAIGSQRHVSIGSRSLPALKEFLKGEQFYRQGLVDSALARYDRAIAEDSTFALALRRMAWATGGGAPTTWKYSSQDVYFRRAVTLNHGLSPRDSVLLRVDSLLQLGTRSRKGNESIASYYAAMGSLEELVRRYPDDPAIWYEVGEHRFHGIPPLAGLPGPALEAFDRAIALDPGFAPAYQHTVRLAIQLGQMNRARAYARAYSALNPSDVNAPALRLAMLIFDSGGVHAPAVWSRVDSAYASTLDWTGRDHFRWMVDTAETAITLLRELATGNHDLTGSPASSVDSNPTRHLAVALVFRGHLREAAEISRPTLTARHSSFSRLFMDRFLDLALWNILPDSIIRATYQRALMPGTAWSAELPFSTPRSLRALPYWYTHGDSTSIIRFGQRASEVGRTTDSGLASLRGRYFAAASHAYLALMRGDSAGAVRQFETIPDTLCLVGTCFVEKLVLAQLIAALGDNRKAAELLDRWERAGDNTTLAVIAALERGEIAERLGDPVTAVARYQFVIDAWRRADPELQPFVARARAGLQRHRR